MDETKKNIKEYSYSTDTGDAQAVVYHLFPGVEVAYTSVHKELDVYKNGKIVYFIEHANVWYTSTGGVQALDTMLADLEDTLLHETSK